LPLGKRPYKPNAQARIAEERAYEEERAALGAQGIAQRERIPNFEIQQQNMQNEALRGRINPTQDKNNNVDSGSNNEEPRGRSRSTHITQQA